MLLAPARGGRQNVGPEDSVRLSSRGLPARGTDQVGLLTATPVGDLGDHAENRSFQVLLDLVGGPQPSGHPVTEEGESDPECEPGGETEEHVHPVIGTDGGLGNGGGLDDLATAHVTGEAESSDLRLEDEVLKGRGLGLEARPARVGVGEADQILLDGAQSLLEGLDLRLQIPRLLQDQLGSGRLTELEVALGESRGQATCPDGIRIAIVDLQDLGVRRLIDLEIGQEIPRIAFDAEVVGHDLGDRDEEISSASVARFDVSDAVRVGAGFDRLNEDPRLRRVDRRLPA